METSDDGLSHPFKGAGTIANGLSGIKHALVKWWSGEVVKWWSAPSFSTDAEYTKRFNPLNAELNPICHLLAFLGAHHILHVSRIRVKCPTGENLQDWIWTNVGVASRIHIDGNFFLCVGNSLLICPSTLSPPCIFQSCKKWTILPSQCSNQQITKAILLKCSPLRTFVERLDTKPRSAKSRSRPSANGTGRLWLRTDDFLCVSS